MTATIAQTVGVDISKHTLDVYLQPQAAARQFPNTAAGISDLLSWLSQAPVHRVVFEPTGAYHHRLERQLGNAGLDMVKVNPLQARRFAEATADAPRPMPSMPPCSPVSARWMRHKPSR